MTVPDGPVAATAGKVDAEVLGELADRRLGAGRLALPRGGRLGGATDLEPAMPGRLDRTRRPTRRASRSTVDRGLAYAVADEHGLALGPGTGRDELGYRRRALRLGCRRFLFCRNGFADPGR